jgi:acetyl-CoA carboxylase biotin carboxyl carrier protein
MAKKSKPKAPSGKRGSGVELPAVEELLDFMQKHGLEEFEYERNGFRIRLKKPAAAAPGSFRVLPAPEILVAGTRGASEAPPAGAGVTGREGAAEGTHSEDLHVVKSPIVGTFYAAGSPGAEPFVTVGAHVESGQVLCIIEAMKLMNEIESDVAGEVVRIFVENGQPVEYGEPLFGIHPHRMK